MISVLPAWPLLTAFLTASLVLAVTPGPAVVYIVTQTLGRGRKAGLASVAGVALGNFGNAAGAAIGLAALFAVSSLAFSVVKYAGAAYLIYLGIRALRAGKDNGGATAMPGSQTSAKAIGTMFRDGFVVALLNPKTALFFAAFLPQFMNPAADPMAQSLLLGGVFVLVAATTDVCYVLTAAAVLPRLAGSRKAFAAGRYLTASAFIGLGVFTAVSGGRRAA
jgi:threonine/homoserine/homoserine lactone efflux protein